MRITPLALFVASMQDVNQLANVVREEVALTHCNEIVQDASICYCIAIKELINTLETGKRLIRQQCKQH